MAIQAKTKTIVDVAQQAPRFSVLVDALKAADLVETLQGKGPFTVFAPTDEAFNKLPKETLSNLLQPENKEELQAILKNHVVAGHMAATDVVGEASMETVQGSNLPVRSKGDIVRIGDATVTETDIEADNGIIHAISAVLLPDDKK